MGDEIEVLHIPLDVKITKDIKKSETRKLKIFEWRTIVPVSR